MICLGDGDDIGNIIELHLLSENLREASQFSLKVELALEHIAVLAKEEISATLIYAAGDDICFSVIEQLGLQDTLISYSKYFFEKTGNTMSFGVGETSIEALVNLRRAKVSGKGCIVISEANQK